MSDIRKLLILSLIFSLLAGCAPRAALRPAPPAGAISPETSPEEVLETIKGRTEGLKGLRASVKITASAPGRGEKSFEGVLYAERPDNLRLTGLALLGVTVFDVVITDDKFYFYQPSEGYLYTGPKASLHGFLKEKGVDVDPDAILRTFFEGAGGGKYFMEKTPDGYDVSLMNPETQYADPVIKSSYDRSLDLKEKTFYDDEGRPYLYVTVDGTAYEGGFRLPEKITARDVRAGYTVKVSFEKYIVNPPEGMEHDFTIEGGELKGIRQVK